MSNEALTSLAVLTVNWNHGHDAIDSFVPLVAACICKDGEQPISAVELQKAVEADVGLKIPMGALEGILTRCARKGLVRRQNKVYVPQRKKLNELDYGPMRAEALRQHGCLLDKLRAFAMDRYDLDWSEDEADAALLAYLQENTIPVLAAATEGDPLPPAKRISRKAKHVLSAFAGHLYEADSEGFKCLETVVKGHVLSTVLFYPDLGQVQTKFNDLDVYCDTPFLLRAIGYTEDGLHAQCVDLVELLTELGASLKCFHHTREEVAGVLEAEAGRLRGRVTDPGQGDFYTSKNFTLSEIEEMIIKIDAIFGELEIEVVDTPTWTAEPDEMGLEETIKKRINYFRDKAREKDVRSLAAVARLRSLRRMEKFESAKAIFVTTNTTLAKASSRHFREIEGKAGIPICMPVAMMTRLAWVKKPLAAPNLPRNTVIASSYAALDPPEVLWREYIAEITRKHEAGKLSDDEYHFLRSSQEARRALMDETFGEETAFSAGTLDEVLAHAKAAIQAEARAETEVERTARLAAEEDARSERGKREGIERAHRNRIARQAEVLGSIVGWAGIASLALLFIVGVLAGIPGLPLLSVTNGFWRITIWVCLGLAVLVNVLGDLKGTTLFDVRRATSKRVERRWCDRGLRKLDELHAHASTLDRQEPQSS